MSKFIFVTGGVVSSLGKGIASASIGKLLESRGLSTAMIKCDPYLNVDPGTMNPFQHGEVYVRMTERKRIWTWVITNDLPTRSLVARATSPPERFIILSSPKNVAGIIWERPSRSFLILPMRSNGLFRRSPSNGQWM